MRHLNMLRLSFLAGTMFILAACGGSSSDTVSKNPTPSEPIKTEQKSVTETPPTAPVKTAQAQAPAEMTEEALLKRGRIVWFKCRSCHELEVDGPHKVGPNLNGIMGATAGKKEGFVYSKVMASSDVVWTDETLDAFIEKPTAFLKGTKMAFVGIRKESDRTALIKYIEENSK